jgi:hypothetical protein
MCSITNNEFTVRVLQIKILKTVKDLAGHFNLEKSRSMINSSNTKNNNGSLTTFGSRKNDSYTHEKISRKETWNNLTTS